MRYRPMIYSGWPTDLKKKVQVIWSWKSYARIQKKSKNLDKAWLRYQHAHMKVGVLQQNLLFIILTQYDARFQKRFLKSPIFEGV